jgi:hypothetical protein
MRTAGSIAIVACILIGAMVCCSRQTTGSPVENDHAEIEKIADSVAKRIEVGDVEGVYDVLRNYWVMSDEELTLSTRQSLQWHQQFVSRFGKVVGVEFLGKEQIGNSFVRFSYLEKFERHGVLWALDFYSCDAKWKVNNIIITDEVYRLFKFGSMGPK